APSRRAGAEGATTVSAPLSVPISCWSVSACHFASASRKAGIEMARFGCSVSSLSAVSTTCACSFSRDSIVRPNINWSGCCSPFLQSKLQGKYALHPQQQQENTNTNKHRSRKQYSRKRIEEQMRVLPLLNELGRGKQTK
ncbi:hypothetical protein DQ04_10481030, partial [Trypanosoma grayi]|uniref:hypothetical protein n=1 Tax=Trypanosoma grayi TaxID=71804 RepID=UPI0004F4715A